MKFNYAQALLVVQLALIGRVSPEGDGAPGAVNNCCKALIEAGLEDRVVFPHDAAYQQSVEGHWSLAARLSPHCFVQPHDTGEVAKVVKTLVTADNTEPCKFAIRSGGHHSWGASIKVGVTLDLGIMNGTTYNSENATASIQPGARWGGVYRTLDALEVAIPGGRASTVGVGGLAIGGGNSFYGSREGWVCDNVIRFEVVLASGEIVEADENNHPDLWRALKGGSGNFGIVTRLDMATFAATELWGGIVTYPNDTTGTHIKAMHKFGNEITNDRYASTISIWQYSTESDVNMVISAYDYTKPVARAPIFDEFLAIPGNTSDSTRITNMADLAFELEQPGGYRNAFLTLTFKNDLRVMTKAIQLHHEYLELIKAANLNTNWTIQNMFQPIPTYFAEHSVRKGGNMLGLERFDDNLMLFMTFLAWQDPHLDTYFHALGTQLIASLNEYAVSLNADNPFIYLDYAFENQDPLAGYGEENLQKMRDVAAKYDPEGVFQRLVPGGFKLSRAGGGQGEEGRRGGDKAGYVRKEEL